MQLSTSLSMFNSTYLHSESPPSFSYQEDKSRNKKRRASSQIQQPIVKIARLEISDQSSSSNGSRAVKKYRDILHMILQTKIIKNKDQVSFGRYLYSLSEKEVGLRLLKTAIRRGISMEFLPSSMRNERVHKAAT